MFRCSLPASAGYLKRAGMNSFFTDLGRTVLARWKQQNFQLAAFPEIAQTALTKRPPAKHVDVAELIAEFLLEDEQPFQSQSGFGQPELIVYDDPRFYIQILFWLEGTTDIHQHQFSGAFHVLAGSSLHTQYRFENAESVSAHLRVGEVKTKSQPKLLEMGSTEPIISGPGYIHSLFHLDTPSLTVVVRTHNDPGTGPQFTYLPPHLAVDPFHHDALTTRRKQLLDVLEKTQDRAYVPLVLKLLKQLDFERGFFILQNCVGHLRALGAWDKAWAAFAKKHGKLAAYVAPTIDEIIWRDALVELRGQVEEPEHRFFLALLLNVSNRTDLLALVARRFGGDPVETVLRWAEELIEPTDFSTWLLDAEFPDDLEVPPDEQPAVLLTALRSFLSGAKPSAKTGSKALPPADLIRLRSMLADSSLRALVL